MRIIEPLEELNFLLTKRAPLLPPSLRSLYDTTTTAALYHLHTLFLFTKSDVKTMLVPASSFGLILSFSTRNHSSPHSSLAIQTAKTIAYVWIHLLYFCISNQRRPESIKEDTINKPWRPFPSKRITPGPASCLLYTLQLASLIFAYSLGALKLSLMFVVLTYLYNDAGLGDTSLVARNLLNGLGYMTFNLGAATVACKALTRENTTWATVLGLVVLSSIHALDLSDQVGDALNGRSTIPLILGDGLCRVSLVVAVLAWSVICPLFWGVTLWGYMIPAAMAGGVCFCLWKERGSEGKMAGRAYMLWMLGLYFLPLFPRT